jgi:hypothetical protein
LLIINASQAFSPYQFLVKAIEDHILFTVKHVDRFHTKTVEGVPDNFVEAVKQSLVPQLNDLAKLKGSRYNELEEDLMVQVLCH